MKNVLIAFAVSLAACAGTNREIATDLAVAQKTAADGVGNAYLDFCEQVRKPRCVAEDAAAKEAGKPQTKEDRVACLRPCDTATAQKIEPVVEVLRAAQLALFLALKDNKSDEDVASAKADLRRAALQLFEVLRESGITNVLEDATR